MAFRGIVGHRRQIGLLGRAIVNGALPPSLIFSGPDGIGKRMVALAAAQALNCLSPVDQPETGGRDACGVCVSCSKIARHMHPDVMRVEPGETGSIKIDAIRQVVGQIGYRPFEGRFRVVAIDQAEALVDDAQNSLLKTLEEPPPRNVVVLVTSQPDTLLDTIRSRCCQVRFAPLRAQDVARELVARHGYADGEAHAAAALSGGSFRRALDAGSAETAEARAVAVAVLQEVARSADPRVRLASAAALLQNASKKGKERSALAVRLRALGSLLRDVTILSTRAADDALVNLDIRSELEPLARLYDRARLERAFSAVGRSLAAVERHNASPKIVADWLAFQL